MPLVCNALLTTPNVEARDKCLFLIATDLVRINLAEETMGPGSQLLALEKCSTDISYTGSQPMSAFFRPDAKGSN